MKITPEMFGLTKDEVAKFEKQDERLAKVKKAIYCTCSTAIGTEHSVYCPVRPIEDSLRRA